jgi:hypothetical protein
MPQAVHVALRTKKNGVPGGWFSRVPCVGEMMVARIAARGNKLDVLASSSSSWLSAGERGLLRSGDRAELEVLALVDAGEVGRGGESRACSCVSSALELGRGAHTAANEGARMARRSPHGELKAGGDRDERAYDTHLRHPARRRANQEPADRRGSRSGRNSLLVSRSDAVRSRSTASVKARISRTASEWRFMLVTASPSGSDE